MTIDPALDALLLVLTLPAALAISLRRRVRRPAGRELIQRAVVAILVALFMTVAIFALFGCECGTGNNPNFQVTLPAAGAALSAGLIGPRRVRWFATLCFVTLGLTLSAHFHWLVLPRDLSSCRFAGDPSFVANSCNRSKIAERSWHTPLTGVYRLRDP